MSAIPIVSPEQRKEEQAPKPIPKVSASTLKRLCRNVIIHGFCKFEDKGCEFNHETDKTFVLPQQQQDNARMNSISSTVSADAPVFVPKSSSSVRQEKVSSRPVDSHRFSAPPQASSQATYQQFGMTMPNFMHGYHQPNGASAAAATTDPYYYMNAPGFDQTPQYHVCPPKLPHVVNLSTHHRMAQSFFIPDNLREQLLKRNEAAITTKSARESGLPEEVHVYHSLYLLEDKPGKILGHSSWVYKAISRTTGKNYTLIRIEGFRLVNEHAMSIVKKWRKIKHANIVTMHEAFTTRAFGDSSLVFVYDYHPCAITLFEAYFTPQAQALLHARFQAAGGVNGMPVPETTLWSFITQLASALKTIHSNGLSARTIEPNKILMTSKNRLRINCSGLLDVLQFDSANNTQQQEQQRVVHQQEDLLSFGKLVVALACNSIQSSVNLPQSFEYLSRFYSPDLKNVALYLLSKPSNTKTIDEVFRIVGPRMLHEANSAQYYTDTLESSLSQELENARLVRLLSKLGFINERPEFDNDPRWSETGDRYMIKLFRDYMFHQVNEMGVPVVDMAHVVTCLNKLDAGVEEKILLTSRDEQTTMIISYKELKASIGSAFNNVFTIANSASSTANNNNKK